MPLVQHFEQLWKSSVAPPDVFAYLRQQNTADSEQVLAVLLADQQRRWLTVRPLQVEDYLAGLPNLPAGLDWKLQLAIGEFEARRKTRQPLSVNEISSRFPDLSDTLRDRLQNLTSGDQSSTRDGSKESDDSAMDPAEVDQICDLFEALWMKAEETPQLEEFLKKASASDRETLLVELIRVELWWRRQRGEQPGWSDYSERFSEDERLFQKLLNEPPLVSRSQHRAVHNDPGEAFQPALLKGHPDYRTTMTYITSTGVGVQQKGRYRLDRVLGEGGFGRVYLGFDEELHRQVAVKVPTKARFQKPEDAETYLAEARVVASLDHPNIVQVYDVGRTEDGSIYVVSRFVNGSTLEERIKTGRPTERESTQLVATVAMALQYAHQKRLIHRDIKPANILIEDGSNTPFVADFGLAIKEEDYLKQSVIAGTPAYMSPEQARGEGHRLDGRSDIFSLGVVLYEMLTGRKPFHGSTAMETLQQVISADPRPPREVVAEIPAELERICLKALSKRASDRHQDAAQFGDDLNSWLTPKPAPVQPRGESLIVPRGLRSYGSEDADFFLDLLPGPRNRDGLPESIAFWKLKIEETDPEQTFSVGLIYGPSGCGKSSLVKAGLLPHLSSTVTAVYIEATPDDTENRLLRSLRKRIPELPEQLDLTDVLAGLRRNTRSRIVLIIDQFEQWLHAHHAEPETELVGALRQCDGGHLQAIVMVRDDFAMAAARFMNALDEPVVQGKNFGTVDLFDIDHAASVLIRFGQAFGRLPKNREELSADQQVFVKDVVLGLAQDGRVVSVRLALFAEMVKAKPWTPATLRQIGGTQGIGINFLEESFSSTHSNPRHRLHAAAARTVLKALLPEVGSDIKGHMRSQTELLAASGYQDRPSDFADLLRILDGELRLITPTDPEGDTPGEPDASASMTVKPGSVTDNPHAHTGGSPRYYQLTHDYLVPSLREWLTRKQKETRRGRAELLLAERAALWSSRPLRRHLPSATETLRIQLLTKKRNWSTDELRMMRSAAQVHGIRLGIATALMLVLTVSGISIQRMIQNERQRIELSNQQAEQESAAAKLRAATAEQQAESQRQIAASQKYFSLVQSAYSRSIARKWGWTAATMDDLKQVGQIETRISDPLQLRTLGAAAETAFDILPSLPIATDITAGAVAFSPDSRLIAIGQLKHGVAPGVFVYDTSTRELVLKLAFSNLSMGLRKFFGQASDRFHDGIRSLAFSADGHRLAAGTRFGRLVWWDLRSKEASPQIAEAFGDNDEVKFVGFLPDNETLIARSQSSAVRFWKFTTEPAPSEPDFQADAIDLDTSTGNLCIVHRGVLQMRNEQEGSRQDFSRDGLSSVVAFNSSGQLIATMAETTAYLNTARHGTELGSREARMDPLRMFFMPNSDVLVLCRRTLIEFLSVTDDVSLGTLNLPGSSEMMLACVSPDGRLLAVPGAKGVHLYQLRRSGICSLQAMNGLAVGDLQWADDSQSYYCLSIGGYANPASHRTAAHQLERIQAHSGQLISCQMLDGFTRIPQEQRNLYSLQVTSDPGVVIASIPGAGLVTANTEKGSIRKLMGSTGQERRIVNSTKDGDGRIQALPATEQIACIDVEESELLIDAPAEQVSFIDDERAPNGRAVRISCPEGTSWSVQFSTRIEDLPPSPHGWSAFAVASVQRTPLAGPALLLGVRGSTGQQWSYSRSLAAPVENSSCMLALGVLSNEDGSSDFTFFIEPDKGADALGWIQIDRFVLVPGDTYVAERFPWSPLQLSVDSRHVAAVNNGRELVQLKFPDMQVLHRWDNYAAEVLSGVGRILSIAAGTTWTLAGCGDDKLRFIRNGGCEYTVDGPGGDITAVILLPDEHSAVIGTETGQLRIVSVPDGLTMADLPAHGNRISSISVSDDGTRLATASTDGTFRLWNTSPSGFQIHVSAPISEREPLVRLSPDGRWLLTARRYGPGVRCWNLDRLSTFSTELGISDL